jgi:VWFA-related protein
MLLVLFSLTFGIKDPILKAQSASTNQDDDVVRVRTDLITVPVRVFNNQGKRFESLSRDDYDILVDGKSVSIDYFAAGAERLALMFALDQSGSVREIIAKQRKAALDLFRHFGARGEVAVMRFDDHATLAANFTRDSGTAEAAFEFSPSTDKHTAIFDSVASALSFFKERRRDPVERLILVVISDGLDTFSRTGWKEATEAAIRSNVSIYSIQIGLFSPVNGHLEIRKPSKGFKELAERSGGGFFVIGDRSTALIPGAEVDLGPVFGEIEADLRNQSILGFYPGNGLRDGARHTIEVRLKNRSIKKLHVTAGRTEFQLTG